MPGPEGVTPRLEDKDASGPELVRPTSILTVKISWHGRRARVKRDVYLSRLTAWRAVCTSRQPVDRAVFARVLRCAATLMLGGPMKLRAAVVVVGLVLSSIADSATR